MTNVRKPLVYASTNMSFERRVGEYLLEKNAHFLEGYHVNRLYETMVGELLREYFLKNDRTVTVHIASSHDDFFSGSDFIITKGTQSVRIDLSLGSGRIHALEENYSLKSIEYKVRKFHESAGIPEEYFATIK